jgi:hypothetical protein
MAEARLPWVSFVVPVVLSLSGCWAVRRDAASSGGAEADRQAIRSGLEAIHAAEAKTLAEGRFVLLDQRLGPLYDLSRRITSGQHWELLPEIIKIIDRHRHHFVDSDPCGRIERIDTYYGAITALANTSGGAEYLIRLASELRSNCWRADVLEALAKHAPVEKLGGRPRKSLTILLTEFSMGPQGCSPTESCFLLKEKLGLLTPIEKMAGPEMRKRRPDDDDGFIGFICLPIITAVEYADKNRNGRPEGHLTTQENEAAGPRGRHWRTRTWIFESPVAQFSPETATLIFEYTSEYRMIQTKYGGEKRTARIEFESSEKARSRAYDYQRRQWQEERDLIHVDTIIEQSEGPLDPLKLVATERATWQWRDGNYVLKEKTRKEAKQAS